MITLVWNSRQANPTQQQANRENKDQRQKYHAIERKA